jgi:creatinine amidohydrolase
MVIEEITMGDFEVGLKKTRTVIIPFGSVEEHGYHLPLSTDTIQVYEIAKKVSSIIPVFVAPPINYGNCRSTSDHPGTISITTNTLKCLLKDIVRSLVKQGITSFIILSGHAGGAHKMALQDAGEELILEFNDIDIAVVVEIEMVRTLSGGILETDDDSHAGEIETSRILHSHPYLVKGEGKAEYPDFPQWLLVREKRKYWQNGVWGDPGKASAEKGKLIESRVVDNMVELVKKMEHF